MEEMSTAPVDIPMWNHGGGIYMEFERYNACISTNCASSSILLLLDIKYSPKNKEFLHLLLWKAYPHRKS